MAFVSAISQRHADLYFPALAESEPYQLQLTKILPLYFESCIKPKFPLESCKFYFLPLSHFIGETSFPRLDVFDTYVDGDKVTLMDFNPWGIVTDSLLFTWNELNAFGVKSDAAAATAQKTPELRVITDKAIRPVDPFGGLHGVPLEYHRLAMDVSESGKQPVEALLELMQQQQLSDEEDMQE